MLAKNTYKHKNTKKICIIALISIMIIAIFVGLEVSGVTHFFNKDSAETTSKEPSAQSNFNDGKERDVISSNKDEGTVTDTKGVVTTTTEKSEWSSSIDGIISVYSPIQDSILSKGDVLSGESSSDNISFMLTDNVSGLIAQGKITVVNGKFSGTFDFKTTATEGRLDIYIENADGVESSIVEIPVRFK